MQKILTAIDDCLAEKNWYAALFLSLTIPDICSKLETPSARKAGARYKRWFDRYLAGTYSHQWAADDETVFLSAEDCWALRCSILHEGSDEISSKDSKDALKRFRFVVFGTHLGKFGNEVVVFQIQEFCREFVAGARHWLVDVHDNKTVQHRMSQMVSVRTEPFSPIPGVRVGPD